MFKIYSFSLVGAVNKSLTLKNLCTKFDSNYWIRHLQFFRSSDLHQIWNMRVFGVTEYESEVWFLKLKLTAQYGLIWVYKSTKFDKADMELLISELQNSRVLTLVPIGWFLKYDRHIGFKNTTNLHIWHWIRDQWSLRPPNTKFGVNLIIIANMYCDIDRHLGSAMIKFFKTSTSAIWILGVMLL